MKEVKVLSDGDGHWYVVPVELSFKFNLDLGNAEMVDSGEFDSVWGYYKTGGDINNVRLFADVENIFKK